MKAVKIMKQAAMIVCLLLLLCGCSARDPEVSSASAASETVEVSVSEASVPEASIPEVSVSEASVSEVSNPETSDPEASVESEESASPITDILSQVSYDDHNFVTEREFYRVLTDALDAYGLKMTACTDGTADFYFDYGNITEVKLMTLSADPQEVAADIQDAEAQQAQKEEALSGGSLSDAQYRGLSRNNQYDPQRDPMESDRLVTAFIIHASAAQDDQTLFYMVSSIAYSILHPDFQDDTTAFDALKQNLFQLYAGNTADADYVSWIHGVSTKDQDASLTIPGNGMECWFGTKEDRSLWLDITPYVYYEELIDVATAIG